MQFPVEQSIIYIINQSGKKFYCLTKGCLSVFITDDISYHFDRYNPHTDINDSIIRDITMHTMVQLVNDRTCQIKIVINGQGENKTFWEEAHLKTFINKIKDCAKRILGLVKESIISNQRN